MDVLTKALSFLKENWKNASLGVLGASVLGLSVALAAANGSNAQLKSALESQTKEADTALTDLEAAQAELEQLKSQYTTMSTKVTPDNVFAFNGVDVKTDTVSAKKQDDGTIVYVDEKTGETLKNEDGTPLTYKDVQAILAENETLKTENEKLTSTVSDLKASNSNGTGTNGSNSSKSSDTKIINQLADENESLQGQVDALNNKVNALTEANNSLTTLNEALAQQVDEQAKQNTDLADATLKYANGVSGDIDGLETKNAELTANLAEVTSSLDAYKTELVTKMNALSDAKLRTATLQTNLNSLGNSLDDTQAQLEAVTTAYNALNGSIDSANIIEAYREAVDNLAKDILSVQAQIDDINKKTEWNELDQAKYDTLQARIDAGDESVATIDEMAAELLDLVNAHTLTEAEEQAIADLEEQKAELEANLETSTQELTDAETVWLSSNPNNSLDNLLSTDEALRTKISDIESEIEEKKALLESAQSDVTEIESEMYRLKESIKELEAQYNNLSLEEKLTGSYETITGDIDFGLSGTTDEYNELVSSVESMITSLKNRVNMLLDYVNETLKEIKKGLTDAGGDVVEDVDEEGHTVIKSNLIHKKVNIVLFKGSQDQITIKGQMPYGQITKTSTATGTEETKQYFEEDGDGSTGIWGN